MLSRNEIIEEARSWVGVPFRHQGRNRNGIDCIGLPILVAKSLGILPKDFDYLGYAREPAKLTLPKELQKHTILKEKLFDDEGNCSIREYLDPSIVEPSDILLFRFLKEPQHVGIYTEENTIIHSYEKIGRCVEHSFDGRWKKRLVGVYRWPI